MSQFADVLLFQFAFKALQLGLSDLLPFPFGYQLLSQELFLYGGVLLFPFLFPLPFGLLHVLYLSLELCSEDIGFFGNLVLLGSQMPSSQLELTLNQGSIASLLELYLLLLLFGKDRDLLDTLLIILVFKPCYPLGYAGLLYRLFQKVIILGRPLLYEPLLILVLIIRQSQLVLGHQDANLIFQGPQQSFVIGMFDQSVNYSISIEVLRRFSHHLGDFLDQADQDLVIVLPLFLQLPDSLDQLLLGLREQTLLGRWHEQFLEIFGAAMSAVESQTDMRFASVFKQQLIFLLLVLRA